MGCAVIFSAQANHDLAAIVGFIAEDNPAAAELKTSGVFNH